MARRPVKLDLGDDVAGMVVDNTVVRPTADDGGKTRKPIKEPNEAPPSEMAVPQKRSQISSSAEKATERPVHISVRIPITNQTILNDARAVSAAYKMPLSKALRKTARSAVDQLARNLAVGDLSFLRPYEEPSLKPEFYARSITIAQSDVDRISAIVDPYGALRDSVVLAYALSLLINKKQ